jgi:pyruvate dehydrogenase E2 component (dihydrolipoamide acetyltransferase)
VAIEVIMPKMEMAQDTGTVVRWLKTEGSQVAKGEPLLEIETDKVTIEVEAPGSGILSEISAQAGQEVPVGQVIALLRSPEEIKQTPSLEVVTSATRTTATPVAQRIAAAHNLDLSQIQAEGRRINKQDIEAHLAGSQARQFPARLRPASPLARRLAREKGLEISQINGSGPGGAVLAADVRAASPVSAPLPETAPPEPVNYRVIPLKGMRKTIAERLQHSAQTAPHIALTLAVDMTEVERLMANLAAPIQQETGHELTLTAVLARVTALALTRCPRLNAHLVDAEIREFDEVGLGIAVALDDGLVVPVIRQAQQKGLATLQRELNELVKRARAGKLALAEVKGGTFTISNLGMYGIEQFTAILNPPEVGILAVGAITPGPIGIGGQLALRPLMRLTLMVDHRAVDGAVGAQFLATLKAMLENPYRLLM